MVPWRSKSVSVRLEEEAYLRLRRHSLRSGLPTSALVRALVHRWLQEQGDEDGAATVERGGTARRRHAGPPRGGGGGEATGEGGGTERRRQPGLFGEGGEF